MGFFDGLTNSLFKKDSLGRHLFYPWGVSGKGFVLETNADYSRIFKNIKLINILTFPLAIFTIVFIEVKFSLFFLFLYIILYHLYSKKLTKNLSITSEKMSLADTLQNMANSFHLCLLIFFGIASLLFVIAGAYLVYMNESVVVGGIGIVFFSLCVVTYIYMIQYKIKKG